MKISMPKSHLALLSTAAKGLAVLLALSVPFAAQVSDDTNSPNPGKPSGHYSQGRGTGQDQSKDQSQDQSMETLKVNVEVVQLFFNVKDKHGALIPRLTKDDFEISEDSKPQTI